MKIVRPRSNLRPMLVAMAVSVTLAACASVPKSPDGADSLRSKLVSLKADPALARQIPVALVEAEAAVKLAETAQKDKALAAHRVYLADHKIDAARAVAQTRLAEEEREKLKAQIDASRLAARTREADAAHVAAAAATVDAAAARADAEASRSAASAARGVADAADADAMRSREQLAELQRQIETLQARTTERGIVLTLGDVLFATGQSTLRAGATGNLDRLVTFLGKYADRTVVIEGHTDSVGGEDSNQALSQRRADAVMSYLATRGVASERLTSLGKGEAFPVSGNDSAGGRQQNRRVEVIIANEPPATAAVLK